MKNFLLISLTMLLFIGCVSSDGLPRSRVIIDMQNIDYAKYQEDLFSCRNTAAQINKGNDAAKSGAGGAVGGAILGSLLGDSSDAKTGAVIGGLFGAAGGASKSQAEIDMVIKNCLSGRGYRVLN